MPSRTGRHRIAAALLGLFVCVWAVLAGGRASAQSLKPFTLKTLDGTLRSLSDVLGRATLVVFFYPTCKYCNLSFPELQRIYVTYRDRGLEMVWINVLPEEERLIAAWRSEHGYTVPVLVGATLRSLQNDYGIAMTPTHFLLDADGRVLWKHAGYKPGDEKTLVDRIEQALGTRP